MISQNKGTCVRLGLLQVSSDTTHNTVSLLSVSYTHCKYVAAKCCSTCPLLLTAAHHTQLRHDTGKGCYSETMDML